MTPHPSRYPTLFGCASGAGGHAVVLGVPYDRATAPQHAGCSGAPAAIRQISAPSSCRADLHGLFDHATRSEVFPAGALSDLGDVRFKTHETDEAYLDQIAEFVRVLASERKRPVLLGGDHVVTLSALRGFAAAGVRPQVVQLDAHHDYEPIRDGERPTHASFVAHAAREGLFAQLLQVGVRGLGWGEFEPPPNVRAVTAEELAGALLPDVPVYLTVDTDGFDPLLAGAVNFPEHEGLALRDLDRVLAAVEPAPILGADWTEYNPGLDTKNSLTGHFVVRSLARILRLVCRPLPAP